MNHARPDPDIECLNISLSHECCGDDHAAHYLTLAETERMVRLLTQFGVRRVRMTDGEPLICPRLGELAARLKTMPEIEQLALTTNGEQLAERAPVLRHAGVSTIDVRLDTLSPQRYRQMTARDLRPVLAGLASAKGLGFCPVRITMMLRKRFNDDEVEDMVVFCLEHGLGLRLGALNSDNADEHVSLADLKRRLARGLRLVPDLADGANATFRIKGTDICITFLAPDAKPTSLRWHLTPGGNLELEQESNMRRSFRSLLRTDLSDSALSEHIYRIFMGLGVAPAPAAPLVLHSAVR